MKRITAFILSIAMISALASCKIETESPSDEMTSITSDNNDTSAQASDTDGASSVNSAAKASGTTESAATYPAESIAETKAAVSDNLEKDNNTAESGRVDFGEYSLILPESWAYEQDDNGGVTFYERTLYDKSLEYDYRFGMIVSIENFYSMSDVNNIPIRHIFLGESNGVYYAAIYPSDVQVPTEIFPYDSEAFNSLNQKLTEERENSASVLDTIEWND